MSRPLSDEDARSIYGDALGIAVRHATLHVPLDEAREVAHHVASALVRRCVAGDRDVAGCVHPRRHDAITSIDAFIHKAVLNRVREIWRSKRRRHAAEQQYQNERIAVAPAWTRPDSNLESRELHDAIEFAIAALPETRRQVFLLIRRDQRSYKEVATQLGIGVGTVHTHLSRANASLRQAIANMNEPNRAVASGDPLIMGGKR